MSDAMRMCDALETDSMFSATTVRGRNDDLRLDVAKLVANDYDPIAPVFDEVMGCDFIEAIEDFRVSELVRALSGKPHCRVLDLCCGTGLFLCRMCSQIAMEGVGIDLSKGQLEIAAARVQASALPIRLIRGDIRNTEFSSDCDLITMNLDSLNHIARWEDWKSIFKRAFESLNLGGLLAFDVNTPERLTRDWNYPEVILKDGVTYIQIGLTPRRVDGLVTRQTPMIIFKRQGALFERVEALVEHTAVPNEIIEKGLCEAGFAEVSWCFPSEQQARRHIFLKNRAFFTAKKQMKEVS